MYKPYRGSLAQQVARAITGGKILLVERVRNRHNGGKQFISVGRYRTAVPDPMREFACISGQGEMLCCSPLLVAKEFVQQAGRALTIQALSRV